uniref:Uncharacterized protein n=1 Tax=Ditylenchus dipsaci TaxID=166011 RepID=A0A915D240_9BILA
MSGTILPGGTKVPVDLSVGLEQGSSLQHQTCAQGVLQSSAIGGIIDEVQWPAPSKQFSSRQSSSQASQINSPVQSKSKSVFQAQSSSRVFQLMQCARQMQSIKPADECARVVLNSDEVPSPLTSQGFSSSNYDRPVKSSLCGSAQLHLSSHAQAPVKASNSSSNQCKAPSQASNQSPVLWLMEAVLSNKSLSLCGPVQAEAPVPRSPFEETVMPSLVVDITPVAWVIAMFQYYALYFSPDVPPVARVIGVTLNPETLQKKLVGCAQPTGADP